MVKLIIYGETPAICVAGEIRIYDCISQKVLSYDTVTYIPKVSDDNLFASLRETVTNLQSL